MSRSVVFAFCILTIAAVALQATGNIAPGLKAGVCVATLYGDDVDEIESSGLGEIGGRAGFVGGFFVESRPAKFFAIQPEVLFAMKGSTVSVTMFGETAKGKTNLYYIEVPLLFKFIYPVGVATPALYAGPAIDFLLVAQAEDSDGKTTDLKEDTRLMDFGLAIGGGLNVGPALFDVRYTWGFLNLDPNGEGDTRNRALHVSVGFGYFR